jgi:hypothetical protein
MDPDARRALRLLNEVAASVPAHEPVELDADYLELVAAVEALPENQSGADKSWLWERYAAYRSHFAVAEPKGSWIHSRTTPRA